MQETINQFDMLSIMLSPDFDKSEWEFSWGSCAYWLPVSEFEANKITIEKYAPGITVFRKIEKTQIINGFTVPAPVRDWNELEVNSNYYFPSFYREKLVDCLKVRKHLDNVDKCLMERGLVFKTEENATAVAKAMLGVDPYK